MAGFGRGGADNGELFFWEGNSLMAVKVTLGPAFKTGAPQKLFTGATAGKMKFSAEMKDFSPTYDVARDASGFSCADSAAAVDREVRVLDTATFGPIPPGCQS